MTSLPRTYLAFQHNAKLTTLSTLVKSIFSASTLDEPNRAVFKGVTFTEHDHIIITPETIFHPQGGGQPSDVGTITNPNTNTTFTVSAVRMGMPPTFDGQVLHLGTFSSPSSSSSSTPQPFHPSDPVLQTLDMEKRLLFSRYHTAGHVLGSAVRHLLEHQVPNFDELKANHFPDTASCEFQGLIDGKHKPAIQAQVDDFLARDMPVEIDFWTEDDFKANGLERLIPDRSLVAPGEKFRVVKIVGAEVYPCGGTHVDSTRLCGKTTVRKISRQKGMSRVSYLVD